MEPLRLERKFRAGLEHLAAGRLGSAEACLRDAAAANPGSATAQYHLGLVLQGRRKWTAAAYAFRAAAGRAPALTPARMGLAAMLDRLGHADDAERHARLAVQLAPRSPPALLLLGDILRGQGRRPQARAAYDAALQLAPDDPDARFRRGLLNLLEGDYVGGWPDYELRPARRGGPVGGGRPEWGGEEVAGKTLLLVAEQGLGDCLQFLRYAPVLAARGARIQVALPPVLHGLAARVEGVQAVVAPTAPPPPVDASCPLGSAPLLCRTRPDAIPGAGGYLSAAPARTAAWKARLGPSDKPTVAFSWAGNPDHPNDHNRSMALPDLAPLLRVPGVRWLSLQKGPAAAQLAGRSQADLVPLGEALADFEDTAAVVACADLVLTVDTALCHLAGGLGRPVWTLLSFDPDWRWMAAGQAGPWYRSMRLFRQAAPRDWSAPIAAVLGGLEALIRSRAP